MQQYVVRLQIVISLGYSESRLGGDSGPAPMRSRRVRAGLAHDSNAFLHGLRASEVTSFQSDAVKDGFLQIQRLKGSLRTVQALHTSSEPLLDLRKALTEYAAKTAFNQPVFDLHRSTFWRIMQRHAAVAGIPAHLRHPHVLKLSIAMQTIETAARKLIVLI